MPKITQRDIVESIAGLQATAKDLRSAVANPENDTALVKASVMVSHAAYLEQVANELLSLIPDHPVKIPPKV